MGMMWSSSSSSGIDRYFDAQIFHSYKLLFEKVIHRSKNKQKGISASSSRALQKKKKEIIVDIRNVDFLSLKSNTFFFSPIKNNLMAISRWFPIIVPKYVFKNVFNLDPDWIFYYSWGVFLISSYLYGNILVEYCRVEIYRLITPYELWIKENDTFPRIFAIISWFVWSLRNIV